LSEGPGRRPRSRTSWRCGCRDGEAACLARTGGRRAQSSSRAALRLERHRANELRRRAGGLAHAGHMKRENPREDAWNEVGRRPREPLLKSRRRADSWKVGKVRARQKCSLPRRRSPVRTRCSAPRKWARRSRSSSRPRALAFRAGALPGTYIPARTRMRCQTFSDGQSFFTTTFASNRYAAIASAM
jgi:hypothetical protein